MLLPATAHNAYTHILYVLPLIAIQSIAVYGAQCVSYESNGDSSSSCVREKLFRQQTQHTHTYTLDARNFFTTDLHWIQLTTDLLLLPQRHHDISIVIIHVVVMLVVN